MRSLNKLYLLGNLGRDPEVKSTQTGGRIANLNVATSHGVKKQDGTWDNKTTWHRVLTFNDRYIDDLQDNLFKGDMVFLSGRLQERTWTDKEGRERTTVEVVVGPYDEFVIIPKGTKPSRRPEEPAQPQTEFDDEIPF